VHEILALFWSWYMYVVYLQPPFSNFSEKMHIAAIYFPPLLQICKMNTSALEILTGMIRPSPRIFFLDPMQFSMLTLAWKR